MCCSRYVSTILWPSMSTNTLLLPLIFILELFAGLSKAHLFQIALFIPEDAAHQSQASFDQVSPGDHSIPGAN